MAFILAAKLVERDGLSWQLACRMAWPSQPPIHHQSGMSFASVGNRA
jgi:hypothetical protein